MKCIRVAIASAVLSVSLPAFPASWPDEPGLYPNRDYVRQSVAEHIDPFNGNLQLHYVDGFVPGNGGFNIRIQRSYNAQTARSSPRHSNSPFGRGWQIHFGQALSPTCQPSERITFESPDGGQQLFYPTNGVAGTSAALELVSHSFWKARCEAGGVLKVYSPDGTRYDMTELDGDRLLAKTITDRNGNVATLTYQTIPEWGARAVSTIVTSEGRNITFSYSTGRLTSINANGRIWNYTVVAATDGGKLLTRVDPPAGPAWNYTYFGEQGTGAGSFALKTSQQPEGGVTNYTYEYVNFLPGIMLAAPQSVVKTKSNTLGTWTFSYSPSSSTNVHDLTTVAQPGSLGTITYRHFGVGTVSSGDVWKVGLLHQKVVSEQTETLSWAAQAISNFGLTRPGYGKTDPVTNRPLLASKTISRDGGTFISNYSNPDAFGNPQAISETGPSNASRQRTISYFNSVSKWIVGFPDDETIVGVGTIARNYDTDGNLLNETRFGVPTDFTYHTAGDLASRRDARNNQTNFSGYSFGIPSTETRPEGVTISRTKDSYGNVLTESDGVATWGFTYDGLNRVTSVNHPLGSDSTITWNATSRTLTRGLYNETTQLDLFGRTTSVTRDGVQQTFQYDALGRKTFESLPGATGGTTLTLDALGRPTQISSPHGNRSYSYQAATTVLTNERSNNTTYTYRRFGDPDSGYLLGVDAGSGTAVTMSKDDIGTLLSVTQGGFTRTFNRDSRLFVTSIVEPETGTTTFGRDPMGNMSSKTLGGVVNTYTYDGLNRLKTITHGDALGTVTLTYDGRSKVTSVASPGSNITRDYDYDLNGNLFEDKLTVDGRVFIVVYGYDGIDGLETVTYPMAKGTVTYTPDNFGRPTKALPYLNAVSHRNSGNLNSITYANGIVMTHGEHFARQLPDSISASAIQVGLNYTYDPAGNVSSIGDTYFPSENRSSINYDSAERLTAVTGPWGTGTIQYGGSGNIELQRFGSYQINYGYSSHRLASIAGSKARSYSYDGRGNVTSNGEVSFIYDNASQVSCAKCGTPNEVRYRYDGQGRRVTEEKAGTTTYFVQSPNGDLQFEYSPYGLRWTKHAYLHGKRIASEVGSDALASSVAMSSSASSAAYGQPITITATVSPSGATGSVEFIEGARSFGVVNLVNGQASVTVSDLAVGAHSITAHYSGNASYQPNAASIALTVVKRSATVSLSGAPPTANVGQSLTLSATVTGTSPTGQVEFRDGTQLLGTRTLAAGAASFTTGALGAGTHSFTATYLGDGNHNGATSAAASTNVVPRADMAIMHTINVNPASTGKDSIFTMTATNQGPDTATNVSVSATYDGSATVIWASPGCTRQGTDPVYLCGGGSLGNGGTVTFKMVLRKDATGSVSNTAAVSSSATDSNSNNNSSTISVPVNVSPAGSAVLRYRLYNPGTREHLYTTDYNEYTVLGQSGWTQEGTQGKVLNNPGSFNGVVATPYYRLYNTTSTWHHWTTDANEYYTLIQGAPWNAEGVDGYLLPTNTTGATQLYRLVYPDGSGLHHWTIDPVEYDQLITVYGWQGEGGSGYVIQ